MDVMNPNWKIMFQTFQLNLMLWNVYQASLSAKEDTIASAVFYKDDKSFPSQAAASSTDIVKQIKADKIDPSRNRKVDGVIP
jgi:hypothetical protein